MVSVSLPPIPWSHSTSDFGSVWVWETPHFVVTVNGDSRSCYYTIADKSANPNGQPKPFADGQAATFEQAERLIRATVGKAYKPTLGYQHFAGPLATTFTIATGEQVDLGVYAGQEVQVRVASTDGGETAYTGRASISHYDFVVTDGPAAVKISPSYILEVRILGRSSPIAGRPRLNRTVEGRVDPGCTGQPGFMAGTVEHNGLLCPIHEEN